MSTNRGIFENATPENPRPDSPFSIAAEQPAPASPFAAAPAKVDSPFAVVDDGQGQGKSEENRGKLPERRKPADSPFQVADPKEGFGFEASPQPSSPPPFNPGPSPFAAAASQPSASPFAQEPAARSQAAAPAVAATPAFSEWQQAAPSPAPRSEGFAESPQSDSYSIKQLELRAIFGVDREMTKDEIMQRTRALPGIRHVARVKAEDVAAVDAIKRVLGNLGFGQGELKLYSGSIPVEFIRESGVQLAVQTDGGFAPGVRETLMLVARELGRMD